jgi:uncharacterized protein (DUF3820 family)
MSGIPTSSINTTSSSNGLFGNSTYGYPQAMQQYQNLYQQQYQNQLYGTRLCPPTPDPLTPKQAQDLIAQLDHDGVLIAEHCLLFGQYMGKSLRDVPLEYIVQFGKAMGAARRELTKELRRRRCLERLIAKPLHG